MGEDAHGSALRLPPALLAAVVAYVNAATAKMPSLPVLIDFAMSPRCEASHEALVLTLAPPTHESEEALLALGQLDTRIHGCIASRRRYLRRRVARCDRDREKRECGDRSHRAA